MRIHYPLQWWQLWRYNSYWDLYTYRYRWVRSLAEYLPNWLKTGVRHLPRVLGATLIGLAELFSLLVLAAWFGFILFMGLSW